MVKKFKNVTVSISAFILIKLAMYSFIVLLPLPEYLKCILISLGFMLSLFLVYLKPGLFKGLNSDPKENTYDNFAVFGFYFVFYLLFKIADIIPFFVGKLSLKVTFVCACVECLMLCFLALKAKNKK